MIPFGHWPEILIGRLWTDPWCFIHNSNIYKSPRNKCFFITLLTAKSELNQHEVLTVLIYPLGMFILSKQGYQCVWLQGDSLDPTRAAVCHVHQINFIKHICCLLPCPQILHKDLWISWNQWLSTILKMYIWTLTLKRQVKKDKFGKFMITFWSFNWIFSKAQFFEQNFQGLLFMIYDLELYDLKIILSSKCFLKHFLFIKISITFPMTLKYKNGMVLLSLKKKNQIKCSLSSHSPA